jgi:hypothetical protein
LVETCGRTVFQNGSGFTWRAFIVMPPQPFFALRSLALRAASAWAPLKASPCQLPPWVAETISQSA